MIDLQTEWLEILFVRNPNVLPETDYLAILSQVNWSLLQPENFSPESVQKTLLFPLQSGINLAAQQNYFTLCLQLAKIVLVKTIPFVVFD